MQALLEVRDLVDQALEVGYRESSRLLPESLRKDLERRS